VVGGVEQLIDALCEAPDTQIDVSVVPKLKNLKTLPLSERPTEMKKILDECAYASLASDFAMLAMDSVWNMMKAEAK